MAYLLSIGIAVLVYIVASILLCGVSRRDARLRSVLVVAGGLVAALVLVNLGWLVLIGLIMAAEDLLPKTHSFDQPRLFVWLIILLPAVGARPQIKPAGAVGDRRPGRVAAWCRDQRSYR